MHAKTRRLNSSFQIAYFLAGSCHTADGAYALLCDLKDDREAAIANYHVSQVRQEAKRLQAQRWSFLKATRLERQADLQEIATAAIVGKALYEAATAELAFIDKAIATLQPFRKYAHLPDAVAHEAAQPEEWLLELIHRGENALLTSGGIPAEQLATMRMHPEFATRLLPALDQVKLGLAAGRAPELLVHKTFDLPKLLPT